MELIDKKLAIAERVAKLAREIKVLEEARKDIQERKEEGGNISIEIRGFERHRIEAYQFVDDVFELHDSILGFLQKQIDQRKAELNELIKIPQ